MIDSRGVLLRWPPIQPQLRAPLQVAGQNDEHAKSRANSSRVRETARVAQEAGARPRWMASSLALVAGTVLLQ